jgi:hypothetical protein
MFAGVITFNKKNIYSSCKCLAKISLVYSRRLFAGGAGGVEKNER